MVGIQKAIVKGQDDTYPGLAGFKQLATLAKKRMASLFQRYCK
jgi:hypothetical protein